LQTSALFGVKNSGFFEIYDVSSRTRGVEPVRTFFGQGAGVNIFAILCDKRPLITTVLDSQLIDFIIGSKV